MTKQQISLRISDELLTKLKRATDPARDPYAPSITQVVERGVELALRELEKKGRK